MNGTMSNMFLNLGSKVLIVLTGATSQVLLARILGPSGRGSYAVALLFSTVLTMLFVLSTDTAGRYYILNRRFTLSEGVAHITICGLIGCTVAVAFGLLLIQLPFPFLAKSTPICFYLALATIPSSFFSYAYLALLAADDKFRWFFIVSSGSSVLGLVLIFVFLGLLRFGVAGAVLAININQISTIFAVLAVLRRSYGLRLARVTRQGMIDMFRYGARYYAGKIGNQANFHIGTIILALFADQTEIGMFSLAVTLTSQIMLVPDSLGDILMPRIAADQLQGQSELVAKVCRIMCLLSGFVLFTFAIFAEPIITVLFSKGFILMVPLVQILSVGFFCRSTVKMMEYYFIMTGNPKIVSTSTLLGVTVNLALMSVLMPILGLSGAATAMSVSYMAGSSFLSLNFCQRTGKDFGEVWRHKKSDWLAITENTHRLFLKQRS